MEEVTSETLTYITPEERKTTFQRAINNNIYPYYIELSNDYVLKYKGKSTTKSHETDDVFWLVIQPNTIQERIRFKGGIDSSNRPDLLDLDFEVKKSAGEWKTIKKMYGSGGRRRTNRHGTKKARRTRRRASRKN